MSVERNKQLATEWYGLLGQGKYAEAANYVSDDFVFYPMMNNKIEGVEAFVASESANMDPMPGFSFDMLNVIGEGDWVAVHFMFEGIFPEDTNEYLGLHITKKHSKHDVMAWVKFNEEGKICEKRMKANMFFVFEQAGVPEILALRKQMG